MSFLVYIISGEGCPEEEEARKLVNFFGSKKSINLDCPATFFSKQVHREFITCTPNGILNCLTNFHIGYLLGALFSVVMRHDLIKLAFVTFKKH